MPTSYPGTKQTFTDPSGTSLLTSPDHASLHTTINDTVEALQDVLGTTAGVGVLVDFASGNKAVRMNSSNVLQHVVSGTVNLAAGTITGALSNTGTVTGGVYATALHSGGTFTGQIVNTGTIGGGVYGTPTIDHFTSSGTTVPTMADRGFAPTVVTLTDTAGGTMVANAAAGQVFHLILGTTAGNRTLGTPLNPTEGQVIAYRVKQNANNTGTLVWAAVFRQNSGGTTVLGTTSSYNYYAYRYNAIDSKWDSQGNSTGIV